MPSLCLIFWIVGISIEHSGKKIPDGPRQQKVGTNVERPDCQILIGAQDNL